MRPWSLPNSHISLTSVGTHWESKVTATACLCKECVSCVSLGCSKRRILAGNACTYNSTACCKTRHSPYGDFWEVEDATEVGNETLYLRVFWSFANNKALITFLSLPGLFPNSQISLTSVLTHWESKVTTATCLCDEYVSYVSWGCPNWKIPAGNACSDSSTACGQSRSETGHSLSVGLKSRRCRKWLCRRQPLSHPASDPCQWYRSCTASPYHSARVHR